MKALSGNIPGVTLGRTTTALLAIEGPLARCPVEIVCFDLDRASCLAFRSNSAMGEQLSASGNSFYLVRAAAYEVGGVSEGGECVAQLPVASGGSS